MINRLAAPLAALAAGCAVAPVQTYEGQPKPSVEIGIVKGTREGGYFVQFSSYARRIRDQQLEFQKVGNGFTGYPTEVHMVPGRYVVLVRCAIGGGQGFPSLDFDVLPGWTYEISCEPALVAARRDGAFRDAPVISIPSGGGGGGYVPSGNHGSRGSAFMAGFMNGFTSGLANASQSVQMGDVRAFISKRSPTENPKP